MSATFGERIKRLRKAYELTQKDVDTFLVNRSRTALTYWESGQGVPGAKNLSSLADFLELRRIGCWEGPMLHILRTQWF